MTTTTAQLTDFLTSARLAAIIDAARAEDLGDPPRDVTSLLTIDASRQGAAAIVARDSGTLAGAAVLPAIIERYDPQIELTPTIEDGSAMAAGAIVAELAGPLRSLLAIERTALNFLTHLSGIATLTRRFCNAIEGAGAVITDTRKTHAGLRGVEKYAVACGGGVSHRMGLHDAVLIKDNHLAHVAPEQLTAVIEAAKAKASEFDPPIAFFEVEVDTLDQLERVLPAEPDIILLDNMKLSELRAAVSMRDRLGATAVKLEASGGVTMETAGKIARTGVDRIAIGALTHSAPAIDLGMDIG